MDKTAPNKGSLFENKATKSKTDTVVAGQTSLSRWMATRKKNDNNSQAPKAPDISFKRAKNSDSSHVDNRRDLLTILECEKDAISEKLQECKESKVIVNCINNCGLWNGGGFATDVVSEQFGNTAQRFFEEKFELEDDSEIGDVQIVKVRGKDEAQKRFGTVWVINAIVLSRKADKFSLSLEGLENAVHAILGVAKMKAASIHLPMLSGACSDSVLNLLEENLAKRKVPVCVYQRASINMLHGFAGNNNNNNATKLQSAGAPGTPFSASENEKAQKRKGSSALDAAEPTKRAKVDLANVFDHCFVYVDPWNSSSSSSSSGQQEGHRSQTTSEEEELKRYLIAYGAEVEEMFSDQVTHVISLAGRWSEHLSALVGNNNNNSGLKVVEPLWVWDCVNTKQRQAESAYLIRRE